MKHENESPVTLVTEMARRSRRASVSLSQATAAQKAAALISASTVLRAHRDAILSANVEDMAAATHAGLNSALLDRLALTSDRVDAIADSVAVVAEMRDPVGMVIDESIRPNGLKLSRVRVPLGVVGIIYESRPNVTADAAALCFKSGNAVILRGGSEASRSNAAIHAAMITGIGREGFSPDAVQLVTTRDRAAVGAMLRAQGQIDMIVPRGGKDLVARVQADARVPVLAHLDGLCHTYIDKSADPHKAITITVNAKMRRPGICGSTETILIDRNYPAPAALLSAMIAAGCELRGTTEIMALHPDIKAATPDDFDTEYLAAICSVAFVDGVEGAIVHIAAHGSHHTDAIIAEDQSSGETFLNTVDSAIVMHNASTQFADGGEFGLGAEIGIATGRLHARGPVALEGLTTYKWIVRGTGHIRP